MKQKNIAVSHHPPALGFNEQQCDPLGGVSFKNLGISKQVEEQSNKSLQGPG